MSNVINAVTPIIEQIISESNSQLVDIEYVKEGKNWFLRVFADKPGGIDIDDCAEISEKLSVALDEIKPDPFPEAYYLEVSSPGVERPLKTPQMIESVVGEYVHFDYYSPQYGEKFHEGFLKSVEEEHYVLETMNKTRQVTLEIPKKQVAKARLAVKF